MMVTKERTGFLRSTIVATKRRARMLNALEEANCKRSSTFLIRHGHLQLLSKCSLILVHYTLISVFAFITVIKVNTDVKVYCQDMLLDEAEVHATWTLASSRCIYWRSLSSSSTLVK